MKTKKTTIIFTLVILAFTILPLISAYNFRGFSYYSDPLDYLENTWVMFGLIFIILFGVMYYVLNKSFKNNAIAAAISLALSLFISMAIAQRGLLYDYGGGELSSWSLVIASLIGIAFLIRFANESFGRWGVAITIGIIWLIIYNLDPYQVLPSSLLNSGFYGIYDFLFRETSGIVIGIIVVIFGAAMSSEGPRTVGEGFMDILGRRTRR